MVSVMIEFVDTIMLAYVRHDCSSIAPQNEGNSYNVELYVHVSRISFGKTIVFHFTTNINFGSTDQVK